MQKNLYCKELKVRSLCKYLDLKNIYIVYANKGGAKGKIRGNKVIRQSGFLNK